MLNVIITVACFFGYFTVSAFAAGYYNKRFPQHEEPLSMYPPPAIVGLVWPFALLAWAVAPSLRYGERLGEDGLKAQEKRIATREKKFAELQARERTLKRIEVELNNELADDDSDYMEVRRGQGR